MWSFVFVMEYICGQSLVYLKPCMVKVKVPLIVRGGKPRSNVFCVLIVLALKLC